MKMASVYLRNNIIYIHAKSYTIEGALIRWPPYFKIEWNDSDINKKLNALIIRVLEGSQKGVPHPTDWDVDDGFLPLANVKTWRQFAAGDCKLVGIELRHNDIDFFSYEKQNIGTASISFARYGDPITCKQTEILDWKSLLTMAFDRCK